MTRKGRKSQSGRGDRVAASCASLASPFGELSSAPLRLLSHPHPLRWAADGSPVPPFPTPIPLKRPSTGGWGPKWSPAERVHLGEEEQGSGPNFRRQAEIEGSGLCDDDGPPIGSTPRLFYSRVCQHRRLTLSRRQCRGGRCTAATVGPLAQQQSISAG